MLEKIFLGLVIVCIFLVYGGVRKIVRLRTNGDLNHLPNTFLFFIFLWLVILWALSSIGFFNDFSGFPPRMFIVLVVPLFIVVMFLILKRNSKAFYLIPQVWLISFQSFRIVVELLLWWMSSDYILPKHMTFEGYNPV